MRHISLEDKDKIIAALKKIHVELTTSSIIHMLIVSMSKISKKQDLLNIELCGADYKKAGRAANGKSISYSSCLASEVSEIQDSLAWKHWKKGKDDIDNLLLETVDVAHFTSSQLLMFDVEIDKEEYRLEADTLVEQLIFEVNRFWDINQKRNLVADSTVEDVTRDIILAFVRPYMHDLTGIISRGEWNEAKSFITDPTMDLMLTALVLYTISYNLLQSDVEEISVLDALVRVEKIYDVKNVLNTFRNRHGYNDGTYVKMWNGEEDNVVAMRLAKTMRDIDLELYDALEVEYEIASTTSNNNTIKETVKEDYYVTVEDRGSTLWYTIPSKDVLTGQYHLSEIDAANRARNALFESLPTTVHRMLLLPSDELFDYSKRVEKGLYKVKVTVEKI